MSGQIERRSSGDDIARVLIHILVIEKSKHLFQKNVNIVLSFLNSISKLQPNSFNPSQHPSQKLKKIPSRPILIKKLTNVSIQQTAHSWLKFTKAISAYLIKFLSFEFPTLAAWCFSHSNFNHLVNY